MSLRIAASLAALALAVSACTSSAGADSEVTDLTVAALMSPDEAGVARLVENFFEATAEGEAFALYAMFTPHDSCRPSDIADRLETIDTGVSPDSELDVERVRLSQIGTAMSISFDLVERQGASEKELVYEEFFPVVYDGQRWRFDADLCRWADEPVGAGDADVRDELNQVLVAAQSLFEDFGTYLATANDLRYEVSGLRVVDTDLELSPGTVLWMGGIEEALMLAQGQSGAWYCISVIGAGAPGYGSASGFEDVATMEGCLSTASVSGW